MVKGYYKNEVKALAELNNGQSGAAYVALRGVTSFNDKNQLQDEYNIHWRPESFVLIQQLIWNLLTKTPLELNTKYEDQTGTTNTNAEHFINSNKVHLMGFSAGGDGAFNLARCLPDLFASVVPAAGYATDSNSAPTFFENYANLPAWLQVGEKDDAYWKQLDSRGRSERAKFYYHYQAKLKELQGNGQNYWHKCDIVQGATHASWFQNKKLNAERNCLRNLEDWWKDPSTAKAKETDSYNLNALIWPKGFTGKLERPSTPRHVVWNLEQRPTPLQTEHKLTDTKWETKRFFYWLFDRKPSKTLALKKTVRASYHTDTTKEESTVWIDVVDDSIGILLREPMVNFKNPIKIVNGTWSKTIKVSASEKIQQELFTARGDKHLVFSALVYFVEVSKDNWEPKLATTLSSDGGEAVIGKLVQ
jgi:pimeloyl-ACP methyl ester carboxylesterase